MTKHIWLGMRRAARVLLRAAPIRAVPVPASGITRHHLRLRHHSSARVSGSAVTVWCQPGDNLMIHAAMEVVTPGDVLVVATTAESDDGMFGELLGESCRAHGVVGLVIDAGVRLGVQWVESEESLS